MPPGPNAPEDDVIARSPTSLASSRKNRPGTLSRSGKPCVPAALHRSWRKARSDLPPRLPASSEARGSAFVGVRDAALDASGRAPVKTTLDLPSFPPEPPASRRGSAPGWSVPSHSAVPTASVPATAWLSDSRPGLRHASPFPPRNSSVTGRVRGPAPARQVPSSESSSAASTRPADRAPATIAAFDGGNVRSG